MEVKPCSKCGTSKGGLNFWSRLPHRDVDGLCIACITRRNSALRALTSVAKKKPERVVEPCIVCHDPAGGKKRNRAGRTYVVRIKGRCARCYDRLYNGRKEVAAGIRVDPAVHSSTNRGLDECDDVEVQARTREIWESVFSHFEKPDARPSVVLGEMTEDDKKQQSLAWAKEYRKAMTNIATLKDLAIPARDDLVTGEAATPPAPRGRKAGGQARGPGGRASRSRVPRASSGRKARRIAG